MVFSSIVFLFYFLPLVVFIYYFARYRNLVLLVASLVFYAWGEAGYIFLLMASGGINYIAGLLIEKEKPFSAKQNLAIAITVNLLILLSFKYTNLFIDSINPVLPATLKISMDKVRLPLGISFFTFHSISYLVDIYRKKATAEKNPINLMLYITMFPQLVAGPIIRFSTIAGEIRQRTESSGKFIAGIRFFVTGLAQKVLVANSVAVAADKIFSLPSSVLDVELSWFGALCYTVQIYFDFAGYSNMAIGLGFMFGLTFPENFNYPYISQSITEFWRRWHITLSQWFRDYVYIPLGGNRQGHVRTYRNLFLVFFLCGLWHGASWTFAAWGMYHGFFLVLERMGLNRILDRTWRPLRHIYAMFIVIIGWVLFRSDSFTQAVLYLQAMAGFGQGDGLTYNLAQFVGRPEIILALLFGLVFSTPVTRILRDGTLPVNRRQGRYPVLAGTAGFVFAYMVFLVLALLVAMNLAAGSYNPFIYFRF